MRNQIIGILLFVTLAAPCALTVAWLQYQKHLVKKEVKKQLIAGVDPSELLLLKFSKEEAQKVLDWEHATEFEFKGKMFDVIETAEKSDSVFYRCWLDDAETHLNQKLAKFVSSTWEKHPQKRQGQQQLLDFFKTFFCAEHAVWRSQLVDFEKNTPTFLFLFDLPKGAPASLSPPPELG